jgi:hypothetical protein
VAEEGVMRAVPVGFSAPARAMLTPLAACMMFWAMLVLGMHGASMAAAGAHADCAGHAALAHGSGSQAEPSVSHDIGGRGHPDQVPRQAACCDRLCMPGFILPAEWPAHHAWHSAQVPPAASRIAEGLDPCCPLRPPNGMRAA